MIVCFKSKVTISDILSTSASKLIECLSNENLLTPDNIYQELQTLFPDKLLDTYQSNEDISDCLNTTNIVSQNGIVCVHYSLVFL